MIPDGRRIRRPDKITEVSHVANSPACRRAIAHPEAARFVGLSIRTLEKHRIYGTGPRYSKLGGRVVYRLEDLQAWVELAPRHRPRIPASATVLPAKRHPRRRPLPARPGAEPFPSCPRAIAPGPNANNSNCSAPLPAISRPAMRRT